MNKRLLGFMAAVLLTTACSTSTVFEAGGDIADPPTGLPLTPDASEPTSNGSPRPSVTPEGVLLRDDFSDAQSGWGTAEDEGGMVGYLGGALVFSLEPAAAGTSLAPITGGQAVDVQAEFRVSFDNDEFSTATFACRYTADDSFYALGVSNDGRALISRTTPEGPTVLAYVRSSAVVPGEQSNAVTASCAGSVLSLDVNGKSVLEVVDDTHTAGRVGLRARSNSPSPTQARFDDVVLSQAREPRVTPSPSPAPDVAGVEVLAEDFRDASAGWLGPDGRAGTDADFAEIAGGHLRSVLATQPGVGIGTDGVTDSAGREVGPLTDVSVEAVASLRRGPGGAVGLTCRERDGAYYQFQVTGRGTADILLVTPDAAGREARFELAGGSSRAIEQGLGATNRLRADCIGSALTFSVNGVQVASARDPNGLDGGGSVGLAHLRGEADQASEAVFDDVVVREIP